MLGRGQHYQVATAPCTDIIQEWRACLGAVSTTRSLPLPVQTLSEGGVMLGRSQHYQVATPACTDLI